MGMGWPVYIQWASDPSAGYESHLASGWSSLPDKGVPDSNTVVDGQPGLIANVMVQGLLASWDCCCITEVSDERLRMCCWEENEDGTPRIAFIWTLSHEIVTVERTWAMDNGGVATHKVTGPLQRGELFASPEDTPKYESHGTGGVIRYTPASEFVIPDRSITRHGILLPDTLWAEHQAYDQPEWTA